jgi:hypothetical protein
LILVDENKEKTETVDLEKSPKKKKLFAEQEFIDETFTLLQNQEFREKIIDDSFDNEIDRFYKNLEEKEKNNFQVELETINSSNVQVQTGDQEGKEVISKSSKTQKKSGEQVEKEEITKENEKTEEQIVLEVIPKSSKPPIIPVLSKIENDNRINNLFRLNYESTESFNNSEIIKNYVSTSTQKTYSTYTNKFLEFLNEFDYLEKIENRENINFVDLVAEYLTNIKNNQSYSASAYRGIVSSIFYFINTNSFSITKEATEKIKLYQKSLENNVALINRRVGRFTKHALMMNPDQIIFLFNNWPLNNYLNKRNFSIYSMLMIGMARIEQIVAYENNWYTQKSELLEVDWKKSKSNQNNAYRHYFNIVLPSKYQFIIDNILEIITISKKFKNNNFVFKKVHSKTNLNPTEEVVTYSGIVKSLKKQINEILKSNLLITGHSFKKSSINMIINDRNKPLISTEVISFQAGWKLKADEQLKLR